MAPGLLGLLRYPWHSGLLRLGLLRLLWLRVLLRLLEPLGLLGPTRTHRAPGFLGLLWLQVLLELLELLGSLGTPRIHRAHKVSRAPEASTAPRGPRAHGAPRAHVAPRGRRAAGIGKLTRLVAPLGLLWFIRLLGLIGRKRLRGPLRHVRLISFLWLAEPVWLVGHVGPVKLVWPV